MSNTFTPDYAVPPGTTLLETINELGITQRELAERMGRSLAEVDKIISGELAITTDIALKLEEVTGVPFAFWENAETNYRQRIKCQF